MTPFARNEAEREIFANIAEHGWQVTSVFDPKRVDPPFSYSIGVYATTTEPEVLIIGVHPPTAAKIINRYASRIKSGAMRYQIGGVYGDLLPGFDVLLIKANDQAKLNLTLSCKWFYQGIEFPLIQCVWQSEDRVWPFEAAAGDQLKRDQPIFGDIPKRLK